ncbi:hypothetical protein F5Y16DRAFT_392451 [Xylariaceae sp. FL0255]|nr:hypothetical protein F5Y16DRAFT_392451 [Xylariaceae sp. FL0255]
MMHISRTIHWVPPALMIGAWFGAILFAVGHHISYSHLNGTAADTEKQILGAQITSQEFTNALGTSFTFVVKFLLVYASTVSYIQIFWRAARQSRKLNTLGDLDSMFSALTNFFVFFKRPIWLKHPLTISIALTFCTLCPMSISRVLTTSLRCRVRIQ